MQQNYQAQEIQWNNQNNNIQIQGLDDKGQQVSIQKLTSKEALALLPEIPDTMNVIHKLTSKSPCCESCGGDYHEESYFEIPSLGNLTWKFDIYGACNCCCCCCGLLKQSQSINREFAKLVPRHTKLNFALNQDKYENCTNTHGFQGKTYCLQNELILFELVGEYGRLYIQGVLVLEFQQCLKSLEDTSYASENSTMPQMIVYEPSHYQNNKIRFKAEKNLFPEHPYSLKGFQSCNGCIIRSRTFQIDGLLKGKCNIINTRSGKQACYNACGCKDTCNCDSCRYADYPEYQIMFEDVSKIDKLAILMCLIHFMMYNEWEFTKYLGVNLQKIYRRSLCCCSIF